MLHEVHTACCAPWCHPVWGLGGVSSSGWSPQLPHPVLWQNSPWASLLGSQGSPEKQNQWDMPELSHGQLFVTPRTAARQAPLSMGFSRQEYWSGWPFPPPGGLPHPGIKLGLLHWQGDPLTTEAPGKPLNRRDLL